MIVAEYVGPKDPYLSGERVVIENGTTLRELVTLLTNYPTIPQSQHWRILEDLQPATSN